MSNDDIEKLRPRCYVIGGGLDYIRLMFQLGCDGAIGLDDADFVLFTGGADVNPEMYGEIPMAKTNFDRLRDNKEHLIYQGALDRKLPMVGICRGGQFLNVENGGKMWQHVTNHTGNHAAFVEVPPFNDNGKRRIIAVTSTHHQMMIPTDEAVVLLTANVCLEKNSPAFTQLGKKQDSPDVEVVFYPDTNCLCFQPHPEFRTAPAECVDFFEECLDNWIYPVLPGNTPKKEVKVQATTPKTKTKKKEKK
jgi:gamma-glutamyl-gamma-aminobutyrate hydrolase PuuD